MYDIEDSFFALCIISVPKNINIRPAKIEAKTPLLPKRTKKVTSSLPPANPAPKIAPAKTEPIFKAERKDSLLSFSLKAPKMTDFDSDLHLDVSVTEDETGSISS